MMSGTPIDQSERDRFIAGIEQNFSVIAPAGVGKTRSIIERILALARDEKAAGLLPKLVVVTYTTRAAREMQQRARLGILREGLAPAVTEAFNEAFFGTIHSFCLRLLRQWGHHLGVPSKFDLLTDDAELWIEFLSAPDSLTTTLNESRRAALFRHVPILQVAALARGLSGSLGFEDAWADCPEIDATALLEARPAQTRSEGTYRRTQNSVRRYLEAWENDAEFCEWPVCVSDTLKELWRQTFGPRRRWLLEAALRCASDWAAAYRRFRVARACLTYVDQITLAADLLRHSVAAREMRAQNWRVILDEAQDTDPDQFRVLLDLAREPHTEITPEIFEEGALRAGHFAMVGDRQQSIYGNRADLPTYEKHHAHLSATPGGGETTFRVTFRCDRAVVDFVNATFPLIFHGKNGQTGFIELRARDGGGEGQVVRAPLAAPSENESEMKTPQRAYREAGEVAALLKKAGLKKLRARCWGEVAIICPRKIQFGPLRAALEGAGLATQTQSTEDIHGESAAYAWFASLIWIMAHPDDGYEIVGVLRELFGLSDCDLAEFAQGEGDRFSIKDESSSLAVLRTLAKLRAEVVLLPLRDAVARTVEEVSLRARLAALPDQNTIEDGAEIDRLVTLSSVREAEGSDLGDFAQELRDNFNELREPPAPREDAIQLITCQKAKGLEWDAVIIPFLFRPLGPPPKTYPLVGRFGPAREPRACLSGDDRQWHEGSENREELLQERDRLLYVTLTRARHTLLLIDDSTLWAKAKGKDTSMGARLRVDEKRNQEVWEHLPTSLAPEKKSRQKTDSPVPEPAPTLPIFPSDGLNEARGAAQKFVRRVSPHQLAQAAAPGDPEARAGNEQFITEEFTAGGGTEYGTWWHSLMETLPWREDAAAWDSAFKSALGLCALPDRARTEWRLFRSSDLAGILARKDLLLLAETPFAFVTSAAKEALEGVIDLTWFDPVEKRWTVLDWKTNRIGPGEGINELATQYRPQISAYANALASLTAHPARGTIYSTALGAWREMEAS